MAEPTLLDLLVDKVTDAVEVNEIVHNDPNSTAADIADADLEVEIAGWALAVYHADGLTS